MPWAEINRDAFLNLEDVRELKVTPYGKMWRVVALCRNGKMYQIGRLFRGRGGARRLMRELAGQEEQP